ncbi:TonB-dependent receptor domain-containing protein [Lewinella sp. IMCC34191]|uniref:TonB-dependent receptor domain-containing protein n=1 Tax=Lewinella sp. IMCC34191 TaxID=2259172 RepID=UPI000E27B337|nr:TonB-dependent receptor [Lewinella sp. IMCC34191]
MDFRYRVLVLLLFLFTATVVGQEELAIIVTDSAGSALPGVELFVEESGRVVTTDLTGSAFILRPAAQNSLVTAFRVGYATQQFTVGPADTLRRVALLPLSQTLSSVTVVGEIEEREALTRLRAVEGTAIYAGRKTEVVSLDALTVNLATNQARQIYAEVSGLNIYENDDAGLQLNIGGRGLDPNRSASFNTRQNGYDISADVLGYPESYYTPPAEALARIEVVRGAASLQYGTQFGGLVNFVFHEPDRTKGFSLLTRQTIGSNRLFTSFNRLSGQLGPLGYYAFYNRKRGDGFRPNSGFSSDNAFVHLDYVPRNRSGDPSATKISFEYTYLDYLAQQAGGLTDAAFYRDPYASIRERNWFAVDWQLYSLRLDHRFSDRLNFSLNVFGLDASRRAVGFRTNRVSQTDDPEQARDLLVGNYRNYGAEARLLRRYSLGKQTAIALLGAKVYRADNTALQGPGSAGADPDFTLATDRFPSYPSQSSFTFPNLNVALFGEHIFYLSDRLSLTPGARFEYIRTASEGSYRRFDYDLAGNPIRDQEFTDDRVFERNLLLLGLGLSYRRSDALELFANASENYRSVTFNDIRTVNPSFQVDPDIRDERGFTADAGLRGRAGRWVYNANVFAIRYGNRLGEVLTAELRTNADGAEVETGRIIRLRSNIGEAYLYGLETLVEWKAFEREENGKGPASALTLFANTNLTDSRYTASDIPGVEGKAVEFIPRLNLKTGLRFGYGNLLGSLQYSYLSEQFTDASNAPQDRRDNQSGIVGSIPAYGVADLSLSYGWKGLTLESGINNLFDEVYFTRRATGYPGPGIIPSAPRTYYLTVGFRL